MNTTLTTIAAVAILAALSPAKAQAEEPRSVSTEIAIGDLDLDTPQGARALENCIALAAKRLCADPNITLDPGRTGRQVKKCRAAATSRAMAAFTERRQTAVATR